MMPRNTPSARPKIARTRVKMTWQARLRQSRTNRALIASELSQSSDSEPDTKKSSGRTRVRWLALGLK
eukprot:50296-Rhodomonas_salina.3